MSGDERVIHRGHISLWASWLSLGIGGLAIILLEVILLVAVLFSHNAPSGIAWVPLIALRLPGSLLLVLPIIRRMATELAVTKKRVIVKFGLFTTHALEMRLGKIETVQVN